MEIHTAVVLVSKVSGRNTLGTNIGGQGMEWSRIHTK